MGGHHRAAQAAGAVRDRRRADSLGEDAALQRGLAELHRRIGLADVDRDDLGLRGADAEALGGQRGPQLPGVSLQPVDQLRLCFQQLQRRQRRADRGRRRRGREDEGARRVDEVVDRLRVGAGVGAV